jgi:hypothetical protein
MVHHLHLHPHQHLQSCTLTSLQEYLLRPELLPGWAADESVLGV